MIDKLAPYGTTVVLVAAILAAVGAYLQSKNNGKLNENRQIEW